MRAAIFLLSATILAHEVLLLRALSIATFSHAAALVVSVALLGFGAAATLLAVLPALKRPATVYAASALYGVLIPSSLAGAAAIEFNVLEVGWDPGQWWGLLALQGVFALPFLAAALAVWTALALEAKRAGPIYGANLLGSGAGALATPWLLGLGSPEDVLAVLAVVAAGVGLLGRGPLPRAFALVGACLAYGLGGVALPMSPFKDLPATPAKTVLETRFGPLGRVDRVASPALHHAPGLSLKARALPAGQEGLYVDGHLVTTRDLQSTAYLDQTVGALPFLLVERAPSVVLLGVGPDLSRATLVVEPDANLLALAEAPGVVADPRAWLASGDDEHDVILLSISRQDPVHETPLLTLEGLQTALARTRSRGVLALSTRIESPPRAALRLLATATRVTSHVVAVRSVDRLCVLMRREAFTEEELQRASAFCDRLGFDVVRPARLRDPEPRHRRALPLEDPGPDYPYDVEPVTDARPYFHRFFRWSRLADVLDPRVTSFVVWPFVALLVGFLQVGALALLFLLGPLLLTRAARAPAPVFLALGTAYMLLEMGFLSRASLVLGGASLAAAAVFGGFLVGSGLGSLLASRLGRPLRRAALLVALLALPAFWLLPASLVGVGLTCALLALPMGIPFPVALGRCRDASVPWALALNGFASVGAAAGAPLVASTFGSLVPVGAGAALYLALAALGRGETGEDGIRS